MLISSDNAPIGPNKSVPKIFSRLNLGDKHFRKAPPPSSRGDNFIGCHRESPRPAPHCGSTVATSQQHPSSPTAIPGRLADHSSTRPIAVQLRGQSEGVELCSEGVGRRCSVLFYLLKDDEPGWLLSAGEASLFSFVVVIRTAVETPCLIADGEHALRQSFNGDSLSLARKACGRQAADVE